jgi:hypothetical protein
MILNDQVSRAARFSRVLEVRATPAHCDLIADAGIVRMVFLNPEVLRIRACFGEPRVLLVPIGGFPAEGRLLAVQLVPGPESS